MSAAALAAALAPALGRELLAWARVLGRAILERLAKRTGPAAVAFFERKSAAWERKRMALLPRVDAAKGKPGRVKLVRKHQAAMRLSRMFGRFARWLAAHLAELTTTAVRAYCQASKKLIERIPLKSADEVACAA